MARAVGTPRRRPDTRADAGVEVIAARLAAAAIGAWLMAAPAIPTVTDGESVGMHVAGRAGRTGVVARVQRGRARRAAVPRACAGPGEVEVHPAGATQPLVVVASEELLDTPGGRVVS